MRNLLLVQQLIESMEDNVDKLESAIENNERDKIIHFKAIILDIQNKIEKLLNAR